MKKINVTILAFGMLLLASMGGAQLPPCGSFSFNAPFNFGDQVSTFDPIDYGIAKDYRLITGWYALWPHYTGATWVNGEVPQKAGQAGLDAHLDHFKERLRSQVPKEWSGYAALNMEYWYPDLNRHKNYKTHYWDKSIEWACEQDSSQTDKSACQQNPPVYIENQAIADFNFWAREFMEKTLEKGRQLYPSAKWGYYGYPTKINVRGGSYPQSWRDFNDSISWLWSASTAIYPDIYAFYQTGVDTEAQYNWNIIAENIKEGLRVAELGGGRPVLPFTWHRYAGVFGNHGLIVQDKDMADQFQAAYQTTYNNKRSAGVIVYNEGSAPGTILAHQAVLDRIGGKTIGSVISQACPSSNVPIWSYAGPGGQISPDKLNYFPRGSNVQFNITPDPSFDIDDVLINGHSFGPTPSHTFDGVSSFQSIEATFIDPGIVQYPIPASAVTKGYIGTGSGPGGSISPSGTVYVDEGSDITFTFHPNPGYVIDTVLIDGQPQSVGPTYTFRDVRSSNHSIHVTFDVETFTLTASAGSGGSISPQGNISANAGEDFTFQISAQSGYIIQDVIVDGISQGSISFYTFNNVNQGHTIHATFSPIQYTIQASAGTGGSISPAGSVSVFQGNNQTFTIQPQSGYFVDDVQIDGQSIGSVTSYTFPNVNQDHTIHADFKQAGQGTHTIQASASPGGTISPEGTIQAADGSSLTFYITPDPGYKIFLVRVDGQDVGNVTQYTFSSISASHDISVVFIQGLYKISAQASAGGSISPSGIVSVSGGTDATFTITPQSGFSIQDVRVDNGSVGIVSHYTFTQVDRDHTIDVDFTSTAPNSYSILASAGAGGSITPGGTVQVAEGSNLTFSVSPNTGYRIQDVIVDGASHGAISQYTFSSISAGHTIHATFTPVLYTISAQSNFGGTLSPTGDVSVPAGTTQIFAITPDDGFIVGGILVDGVSVGIVTPFVFSNVNQDHTITVFFLQDPNPAKPRFTIDATAGSNGTITPSGSISVVSGNSITFSVVPDPNYAVKDVIVDGISRGPQASHTFSDVTQNHTIHAEFQLPAPNSDWILVDAGSERNGTVGTPLLLTATIETNITGPVQFEWRFISGPGNVDFDNMFQPETNAVFSEVGVYHLEAWAAKADQTVTAASPLTVIVEEPNLAADEDGLFRRFINRFSPAKNEKLQVAYQIREPSFITLQVLDKFGQIVNTVQEVHRARPGEYTAEWDGKNDRGITVSSGMYLLLLKAGTGAAEVAKFIVLK